MNKNTPTEPSIRTKRTWLEHPAWIILALYVFVAVIRIMAPSDLYRGDQPKQADYLIDIVVNGNWTVQHHADGSVATKPPLYNWLAAPMLILTNSPSDFLLKLPSLLAGLATIFMLWDLVRKLFNDKTALLAALFTIASIMYAKQIYFARTDMLLTMFTVMQFWAVIRMEILLKKPADASEDTGSDPDNAQPVNSIKNIWLWIFWGSAGLSIITKGPVAVLLVHSGLIMWWLWERRLKISYTGIGLWWGIPVMLIPTILWVSSIYIFDGMETLYLVYQQMIGAETQDRFARASSKSMENRHVFYYIPHLIGRMMPWSLSAVIAMFLIPWKSFRNKKVFSGIGSKYAGTNYSGAIFAVSWMLTTLFLFSVIPSKRVDRIFPLVPAVCILAGWLFDAFIRQVFDTANQMTDKTETQSDDEDKRLLSKRILTATKWVNFFWISIMSIAGIAMIAIALLGYMTNDPDQVPSTIKHIILFRKDVTMTIGIILSGASLMSIFSYRFRMKHLFTAGLIVGMCMIITFYQHVQSDWGKTGLSRSVTQISKHYRKQYHKPDNRILILNGYRKTRPTDPGIKPCRIIKRPLRFYLMEPELEVSPDEAARIIKDSNDMFFVFGTRSIFDKKGKAIHYGTLDYLKAELDRLRVVSLPTPLIQGADEESIDIDQRIGIWVVGKIETGDDIENIED